MVARDINKLDSAGTAVVRWDKGDNEAADGFTFLRGSGKNYESGIGF
jgi:hypothetical protein